MNDLDLEKRLTLYSVKKVSNIRFQALDNLIRAINDFNKNSHTGALFTDQEADLLNKVHYMLYDKAWNMVELQQDTERKLLNGKNNLI